METCGFIFCQSLFEHLRLMRIVTMCKMVELLRKISRGERIRPPGEVGLSNKCLQRIRLFETSSILL